MTSKISFFKLVRMEMRHMSWLTVVQLLAFVLFFPFRALMAMAIRQKEKVYYGKTTYTAVTQFSRNIGLGHMENTCLILLAGAVCALAAFAYVHSQVKQDFYHSLSMKREELFCVKYLSSTLTFVIAYLVSQILVILVGLIYQVLTPQLVFEIILTSIQGILFFLCSYSSVLVAIMLTGNFLTTVLAVGVFGLYPPLMVWLSLYLQSTFLDTSVSGAWTGGTVWLSRTSAWAWCLFSTLDGSKGMTETLPSAGNLCELVAIAALLTLIAVLLYRARKTEAGGSALAFCCTEPVIKIMMAIPASLVAGLIAYELVESIAFELLFILIFGALTCVIIEFIYRMDIRQVLAHKWQFTASVLLACIIFFAFRFDVFGYNTWLPREEELASMAASCYWIDYTDYQENGEIGYYPSQRERLDSLELDEFDRIYELAQNGVENEEKYGSSYSAYDEEIALVYLKYHLKNGKEVYRCYEVNLSLYVEVMDELLEDDDFRARCFPICGWDDNYMSKVSDVDCWTYYYDADTLFGSTKTDGMESDAAQTGSTDSDITNTDGEEAEQSDGFSITVPLSKLSELVEAYREDLKTVSFEDIVDADGCIDFWIGKGYLHDYYKFTENFTRTLEVLKECYYS